ncbi:expressed protein [Phakopsora pachyrhizi]|uniref:Expressed protein n=1 Tax=Phakopsora pachyrhizi TaxID=170000 RepID=A0AAV0AZ09_PHAPC|nr:expressed protein [Phakopsora pachyrhizi]
MQHVLEESHSGLLLKLKSSREEILKSGGEEAYSNLQRLLDNLDLYQFESSREVYRIYEASLKFQKERKETILGDFHKLFAPASANFYPNFKVENLPAINFAFRILDWIALNEPNEHILLYNLLNDKIMMEGLNWYTSSQVIINRGYIEVFKTNEIQDLLLNHQDLGAIRNILNCLGENHLKKLELGFIRAHMNSLIKDNNTRAKFEEILKKMEEALSFSPNWLNVLHMNSVKQDSPTFFAEKVLFLHALNYCYGVYHNFKYGSPIRTKVDIFEECFNLFKRQLMVLLDLAESENCSQVDISTDFPVMHYLLGLELMAMRNSLPGEDEIERRKSRFLKQYNKLERTYNNFFYSPSFFGTVDLKNEITIWENNTPMNEINNEINMLHGLHKSMKIVEKSDA